VCVCVCVCVRVLLSDQDGAAHQEEARRVRPADDPDAADRRRRHQQLPRRPRHRRRLGGRRGELTIRSLSLTPRVTDN